MLMVLFFTIFHCVFPCCCVDIGRQVILMLSDTSQEIYDTSACLIFWQSWQIIKIHYTFGRVCTAIKGFAGRSFFKTCDCRVQGLYAPAEREGSAWLFMQAGLRLQGASHLTVGKVPHKSQCKITAYGSGKSNHTLARCVFFYNTDLQKS